jgi:HPt (histidine-containing phosphotransfer) domain-containing protein
MVPDFTTQLPGTHLDAAGALMRIGDADVMRDMLSMMAELLATDMPKIAASLQAGDMAEAARSLHSLKGCIPIFCPAPVSACVELSELSAKSGDLDLARAEYRNLEPILLQLGEEIVQYLRNATPQP